MLTRVVVYCCSLSSIVCYWRNVYTNWFVLVRWCGRCGCEIAVVALGVIIAAGVMRVVVVLVVVAVAGCS